MSALAFAASGLITLTTCCIAVVSALILWGTQ